MKKSKKYILFRITETGIYFNKESYFNWNQTNFPLKENFSIKERKSIFWLAEQIEYDQVNRKLDVQVVDYYTTETPEFAIQKPKRQIGHLHFHNLSWIDIQAHLQSYQYKAFMHLDIDAVEEEITGFEKLHNKQKSKDQPSQFIDMVPVQLDISITDFDFKSGFVVSTQYFDEIQKAVSIRVENPNILPQFDYIKHYFKKYFKNERARVKGKVIRSESGQWHSECRSSLIQKIDDEAITGVRSLMVKEHFAKPTFTDVDKSLFTSTDIFLNEHDQDLGAALNASELDLIKEGMAFKGVRNSKQLIYLSGKIHQAQFPIRFTLAPEFGFLFYHEGEEMRHFIWELLNTNATYIWSIYFDELSAEESLIQVEQIIRFIRQSGRRAYLSQVDHSTFVFRRIRHKHADSKIQDSFPLWKAKLDQQLV